MVFVYISQCVDRPCSDTVGVQLPSEVKYGLNVFRLGVQVD